MSTFFEWTENMSVGENKIDGQHKRLLGQVNKIIDALVYGVSSRELREAIKFFEEYIYDHLAYEEEYMKKINFPNIDEHIKQHKIFVENYSKFKNEFNNKTNEEGLAMEIERFIGNWWVEHIGYEDHKYYEFVNSKK